VVKYLAGSSTHGSPNEYPFLISFPDDEKGISVLPITSIGLDHPVVTERISTGIPRLDTMMGGKGFFRGSSVLLSGTAGTGKTSVAASFIDAACRRGEKCIYFAFEESAAQIIRNMRSIGIDLDPWLKKGLLKFHTHRPSVYGLEAHLLTMSKVINEFKPAAVAVDPVTNLLSLGDPLDVKAMLIRLIDFLKMNQITAILTNLTSGAHALEATDVAISSMADTWLLLRDIEAGGERNRGLYILKSRGMAHSNQIREFLLTDRGIDLLDVYVGPSGVLTGSARVAWELQEQGAEIARREEMELKKRGLETRQKAMEAQIAALQAELEAGKRDLKKIMNQEKERQGRLEEKRKTIGRMRKAD
jgi:circadian clock protein KaiC